MNAMLQEAHNAMSLEAAHLSQLEYVWMSKLSLDDSIAFKSIYILQATTPLDAADEQGMTSATDVNAEAQCASVCVISLYMVSAAKDFYGHCIPFRGVHCKYGEALRIASKEVELRQND